MIDRSPADSIVVYLALRGDASFASQDGRYRLRPGDALVCETDRPFTREFARGLTELVVTIPHSALAARATLTRLRNPVIISFGGPAAGRRVDTGAPVRQYARALRVSPGMPRGRSGRSTRTSTRCSTWSPFSPATGTPLARPPTGPRRAATSRNT